MYNPHSKLKLVLKGTAVIIGLLVIAFIYAAYQTYQADSVAIAPETFNQETMTLDGEVRQQLVQGVVGNLIVARQTQQDERSLDISTYLLNAADSETIDTFVETGITYNFVPVSDTKGAAVQYVEAVGQTLPVAYDIATGTPTIIPITAGYHANRFMASPYEGWYGGDIFKQNLPPEEKMNLDNWQVVIVNPDTNRIITLDGAASPQWLNDGQDVVYIRPDGIYRYNFYVEQEEKIYDLYTNLTANAQLAISPDANYLVLTLPTDNIMAVLKFTDPMNGELTELNRVVSEDINYSYPVFAPSGLYYAVLTSKDSDYDQATRTYRQNTIAVYSPLSIIPLHTLSHEGLDNAMLSLSAWTNFNPTLNTY